MIDLSSLQKVKDAVQTLWHVVMGNGSPSIDKRINGNTNEIRSVARELSEFKQNRAETCVGAKAMEKAMADHINDHHQHQNVQVATIGLIINSIGIVTLIVLHFL